MKLILKYPLLFTFTKFTFNIVSTTTIVQIDVTENLVNETEVQVEFLNSTLYEMVSTGFLADNSELIIGTKSKKCWS